MLLASTAPPAVVRLAMELKVDVVGLPLEGLIGTILIPVQKLPKVRYHLPFSVIWGELIYQRGTGRATHQRRGCAQQSLDGGRVRK